MLAFIFWLKVFQVCEKAPYASGIPPWIWRSIPTAVPALPTNLTTRPPTLQAWIRSKTSPIVSPLCLVQSSWHTLPRHPQGHAVGWNLTPCSFPRPGRFLPEHRPLSHLRPRRQCQSPCLLRRALRLLRHIHHSRLYCSRTRRHSSSQALPFLPIPS